MEERSLIFIGQDKGKEGAAERERKRDRKNKNVHQRACMSAHMCSGDLQKGSTESLGE